MRHESQIDRSVEFKGPNFHFQGFTGLTELFPREEFCANVVNGDRGLANGNFGMGQAVARILIDRYYKKREKFEVRQQIFRSENEPVHVKTVHIGEQWDSGEPAHSLSLARAFGIRARGGVSPA